ncbi:hypothetical protein K2X33_09175, partial [bacterium]|nr:hypothetical protein [bacterium]
WDIDESLTLNYPGGKSDTFKHTWSANLTKNGFFDVVAHGKTGGWGTCAKTECQVKIGAMAETFHFDGDKIYLVGMNEAPPSTELPNGIKVSWRGMATKKATP